MTSIMHFRHCISSSLRRLSPSLSRSLFQRTFITHRPSNPRTNRTHFSFSVATTITTAASIHTVSLVASSNSIAPVVGASSDSSASPNYLPFMESDSTPPYAIDDTQSNEWFRSILVEQASEEMWLHCKWGMTSVGWPTKQQEFDSIVAKGIDYDSDSYIQSMRKLRAQIAYMQSPAHRNLVFEVLGYCHSEFLNWAKEVSRIRIDVNQSQQPELHMFMQAKMPEIIQAYYDDVEEQIKKKASSNTTVTEEGTSFKLNSE